MIAPKDKFYKEIRCGKCRKLLGLEYIFRGRLAIKCRCGEVNYIEYKTPIKKIEKIEAQGGVAVIRRRSLDLEGGVK